MPKSYLADEPGASAPRTTASIPTCRPGTAWRLPAHRAPRRQGRADRAGRHLVLLSRGLSGLVREALLRCAERFRRGARREGRGRGVRRRRERRTGARSRRRSAPTSPAGAAAWVSCSRRGPTTSRGGGAAPSPARRHQGAARRPEPLGRRLRENRRGHDVAATRRALRLLRRAGFKIHAHWMPNLLGSTPAADVEDFARLFDGSGLPPRRAQALSLQSRRGRGARSALPERQWRPYTHRGAARGALRLSAADAAVLPADPGDPRHLLPRHPRRQQAHQFSRGGDGPSRRAGVPEPRHPRPRDPGPSLRPRTAPAHARWTTTHRWGASTSFSS